MSKTKMADTNVRESLDYINKHIIYSNYKCLFFFKSDYIIHIACIQLLPISVCVAINVV